MIINRMITKSLNKKWWRTSTTAIACLEVVHSITFLVSTAPALMKNINYVLIIWFCSAEAIFKISRSKVDKGKSELV